MDMNFNGNTSTEQKKFGNFCIREYVAEVRKRDWKICCPFNLGSNRQAEIVYASLFLDDDDLVNTQEDTEAPNPSEEESYEVEAARSETHTDTINIGNDVISNNINDEPLESVAIKTTDAQFEIEKTITGDAVAYENNNPHDVVVNDAAVNNIHDESLPSKIVSIEVKHAQGPNEKRIAEDVMLSRNDKQQRNSGQIKPQRFRMLSDVYKEVDGSCDAVSSDINESKLNSDSDDDSDNITLATFIRNKKGVSGTSRSSRYLKGKIKTQAVAPRTVRCKRTKPVSEELCGKSSDLSSKSQSRKTRIVCAPSSLRGEKNTSGTHEESLLADRTKRNRENTEEDHGMEVFVVQPSITVSNNIESPSGCVQKRIRVSSPLSDNEIIAAMQLISMSNGEVQTKTSSKTVTKEQALSKAKGKDLCELDEYVPPASRSGLPQNNKIEYGISVCMVNMNPSEFEIDKAKKFRRRGQIIGKGGN